MNACKLIISCKNALKIKYGADFPKLEKLLKKLAVADKKLHLDTKIVFIDDAVSARRAGIRTVKSCTRQQCKKAVDDLYKKWLPAYIVLFGAQDIFPFQELNNPAGDEDEQVPTDLPYACESGYSKEIASFTGPTRVVGRIPDIPGKADLAYVTTLLTNITRNKPGQPNPYLNYFALTADVWKKSTQLTVQEIFGNTSSLQYCPPAGKSYTKKQLNALTQFL